MIKVGLIINPVAGIGGKVGLKGSDGEETQRKALALGARPESALKAGAALRELVPFRDRVELYTYPGAMGEEVARPMGFHCTVLGEGRCGATTPKDTVQAAKALYDAGVELLLFAGGDGTARNILDALHGARKTTDVAGKASGSSDAARRGLPVIGIPAGCKIYSAVYAVNPKRAGELAARFVQGEARESQESEVLDIDEELFRRNVVQSKLYGYLTTPGDRQRMQNLKSGGGVSEAATVEMLANYVGDHMEPGTLYIMGSGSTIDKIATKLGFANTLLGVDLVLDKKVAARDVSEAVLLEYLERFAKVKVVVTIIGGQGYLFGRGNQQLSARVLHKVGKENILVVAAKSKLLPLVGRKLYVDTGVEAVNRMLSGYYRVAVGYDDFVMLPASD